MIIIALFVIAISGNYSLPTSQLIRCNMTTQWNIVANKNVCDASTFIIYESQNSYGEWEKPDKNDNITCISHNYKKCKLLLRLENASSLPNSAQGPDGRK